MKLTNKELNLIINWFEMAQESLGDKDLKLFDKICNYLDEDDKLRTREDSARSTYLAYDEEESDLEIDDVFAY